MSYTNKKLWVQLRPYVASAQKPSRYINHEWVAGQEADLSQSEDSWLRSSEVSEETTLRFCMIYPDVYEVGQANQAVRILVNAINKTPHMTAERAYLPAVDLSDQMREHGLPLTALESCDPLGSFDVIGITLSHELVATNVLEVLDLAGIPLRAQERSDSDPLVIAGGPCAANPEPFAPFFDAITIGEGEEATPRLLEVIRQAKIAQKDRSQTLAMLLDVPGTYVPSFYRMEIAADPDQGVMVKPNNTQAPHSIPRQIYEGFSESSAWEPCVVPYSETIHDRLSVEILRGCARGCRFCQAGTYYRPVRERSVENIVNAVYEGVAQTGYDEVSLTSLSTTDHSHIGEILQQLNDHYAGQGIRISIPSQRLDSFGVAMAELVAGSKKGGLTFAPEAGSQRLRNVINKKVTEDDLMRAVDAAFGHGWRRLKLYFMLGLPTETDDDVVAIAHLADRVYERACTLVSPSQKSHVNVSLSAALFVPKPQTAFQWDGQIPPQEAQRRIDLLRRSIRHRAVNVHWHDPATSYIEAALSRGDRRLADWIEAAWRHGARFDAWSDLFNQQAWDEASAEMDFDPSYFAQKTYKPLTAMAWDFIEGGVSREFLARERKRADAEQTTPDCTFGSCSGCGLCPTFGVHNVLCGTRVANSTQEGV